MGPTERECLSEVSATSPVSVRPLPLVFESLFVVPEITYVPVGHLRIGKGLRGSVGGPVPMSGAEVGSHGHKQRFLRCTSPSRRTLGHVRPSLSPPEHRPCPLFIEADSSTTQLGPSGQGRFFGGPVGAQSRSRDPRPGSTERERLSVVSVTTQVSVRTRPTVFEYPCNSVSLPTLPFPTRPRPRRSLRRGKGLRGLQGWNTLDLGSRGRVPQTQRTSPGGALRRPGVLPDTTVCL